MAQQLRKEQAIIIMGFTGITTCNFGIFHKDVESRLGRPVWTHEFGSEDFAEKVKDLYKDDFLSICYKGEEEA